MLQLSSVKGNSQWLDGGSMFGNAPRTVWEKWTQIDEKGRIPLSCRCLLLELDNKKILFETGIGAFFEPKLADRFGVQDSQTHVLIENLKKMNLDPGDIDYVILSHLHFDHAGGLLPTYQEMLAGNEGLSFTNAQILVGKEAWQRALKPHPRDRASFIPELNKRLQQSKKLMIIDDQSVPPALKQHLSFTYSYGHTPGQMHSLIRADKETLIFAADLIPGSAWVHLPITMGYDRYPERLIDEKEQLYKSYHNRVLFLYFTHDPEWAMGRLTTNEKGHYVAQDLKKELKSHTLD